jgi:hypothetical protein
MEFIVTDRCSIEAGIIVRTPYIVISIYTPYWPEPKIPRPYGLKAVHFTSFHDAESTGGFVIPEDVVLMDIEQAKAIWEFVKGHCHEVGTIVCHCEQGMSRSPAVAIALAEAFGSDVTEIRDDSYPNELVYRLMKLAIAQSPLNGNSAKKRGKT